MTDYPLTEKEILQERLQRQDTEGFSVDEVEIRIANAATAKVKSLMEAEHKAEMERLVEEIEKLHLLITRLYTEIPLNESVVWHDLKSRYGGK